MDKISCILKTLKTVKEIIKHKKINAKKFWAVQ
jgi:hypothetical protein